MTRPLTVILLLFSAIFAAAQGNCIPVKAKNGDYVAYKSGEKLDFVLHYTFGMVDSDMGTATITLDTLGKGRNRMFHCRVLGKTTPLFDYFFRVREDFNSYFSYKDLTPLRFTRDTHEGKYTATNDYTYVWDAPEPYIDAKVYTSSAGTEKRFAIPLKPCTFDLPSLFFFARNIDMSRIRPGEKHPMTFAIDDDVYDVYFIYKGKETKKVYGLGTFRCLHFVADLLKGEIFSGNEDMHIYISDDKNRLPLYFYAPILVGKVEGRMTSCEGLKYQLSSKVK